MTVAVDGVERYRWPVSSGLPSYETPNGSFRTFRMEEDHYSKEFDDAPMPHSIFFTKQGHAIHGTDSVNRLGSPASHGCVRLSRDNASKLYALVQEQGVLNTTVTLTGSSQSRIGAQSAAAHQHRRRPPRPGAATIRAADRSHRRRPRRDHAAGSALAPPQVRADDGYIYPADGSSNEARYPAPRGRRLYGAQAYPQPQQQYYDISRLCPGAAGLLLPAAAAALLSAARAVHLPGLTQKQAGDTGRRSPSSTSQSTGQIDNGRSVRNVIGYSAGMHYDTTRNFRPLRGLAGQCAADRQGSGQNRRQIQPHRAQFGHGRLCHAGDRGKARPRTLDRRFLRLSDHRRIIPAPRPKARSRSAA